MGHCYDKEAFRTVAGFGRLCDEGSADLSRKQGSGREIHHSNDIQFVPLVALALSKNKVNRV